MTSTPLSRFLLRLGDRALRGYEILLFGVIVAMAIVAATSAGAGAAGDEEPFHCGKNQSSAAVITR